MTLQKAVDVEDEASSLENGIIALSLDDIAERGAWRTGLVTQALRGKRETDEQLSVAGAVECRVEDVVGVVGRRGFYHGPCDVVREAGFAVELGASLERGAEGRTP